MYCKELKGKEEMFQITAVCDLMEDRMNSFKERYNCRTYENYKQLLADEEVELVAIATRSCDHFRHTVEALEAGKDVFLEKPICINYKQTKELEKFAKKAKSQLFVRHNRRFEPHFLHIQEIISSGRLGEVFQINLARLSYLRRSDWQTIKRFGGGQLLNWGPHLVDHGLRLLESPLVEIWGDIKRVAATGNAEDHVKIIMKGKNGRVVDIQISGGVAIPVPLYQVWGTRGSLIATDSTITIKYLDSKNVLSKIKADTETPAYGSFGNTGKLQWIEESISVKPTCGLNTDSIWTALYESIRNHKKFPISLEQAFEVMRVLCKLKENSIRHYVKY